MAEVIVKIPEAMKDIIDGTSETIYVEALKEVALKRISYSQKRLKELKKKIARYEKKYDQSYAEFVQNMPDTVTGHDDWIEWSYLVKISDELSGKLAKIKLLIGK